MCHLAFYICHAQKTLKIAWSRKIRLKIVVIVPDLFNLDWIQKPLLFPKIDRHCLTSTVYSLYPTVNPLYTHCTDLLYHTVQSHCTPLDSTVPTHWPALYLTVHHCTGHWPALYPTIHHCTGYWQTLYTTVTHCTNVFISYLYAWTMNWIFTLFEIKIWICFDSFLLLTREKMGFYFFKFTYNYMLGQDFFLGKGQGYHRFLGELRHILDSCTM